MMHGPGPASGFGPPPGSGYGQPPWSQQQIADILLNITEDIYENDTDSPYIIIDNPASHADILSIGLLQK